MNNERLEMEGRLGRNNIKVKRFEIKGANLIKDIRSELGMITYTKPGLIPHINMELVESLVTDLKKVRAEMVLLIEETKTIKEELGIEEEGR